MRIFRFACPPSRLLASCLLYARSTADVYALARRVYYPTRVPALRSWIHKGWGQQQAIAPVSCEHGNSQVPLEIGLIFKFFILHEHGFGRSRGVGGDAAGAGPGHLRICEYPFMIVPVIPPVVVRILGGVGISIGSSGSAAEQDKSFLRPFACPAHRCECNTRCLLSIHRSAAG